MRDCSGRQWHERKHQNLDTNSDPECIEERQQSKLELEQQTSLEVEDHDQNLFLD